MYILDTDIISNVLKKNPCHPLLKRLKGTSPSQQFTTSITIGELFCGAYRSERCDELLNIFSEKVIPQLQVLPFDQDAGKIYGKLRASLERKGICLSEPDLRIAAITISNKMVLISGNIRHFSVVPGLKLENWLS